MFKFLRHLFLPHHTNNQRARLIHHDSLLVVIAILLAGSFFLSTARKNFPQVLGISADISNQQLLLLTNEERQKAGLAPLNLNGQLSQAAAGKAQDMFAEDYWAHFSPSGKSPWDFIKGAGYSYVYAGENLARGFTTANDVINAWMASPDHRANMLSPNYQDVGFAVAEGRLPGDSDTILVVEEFGSRALAAIPSLVPSPTIAAVQAQKAQAVPVVTSAPVVVKKSQPPVLAGVASKPLIDSATFSRGISIFLLSMFLMVFALDIVITESKKTVRLAGHSFDHLLFLGGIVLVVIIISSGVIA